MADFISPYDAAATNPYLQAPQKPDWMSVLGTMLTGVGAGIGQADAAGRGWGAGIAPGAMYASQSLAQQQQQQFAQAVKAAEWQQMEAYRKAQEENIRSQIEERNLGMNIDKGILGQINGGPQTGLNYQPPAVRMGPDFQKTAQPVVSRLVDVHGFSPVAAAGIAGNLAQESGFDPSYGFTRPPGLGGATGIAQWDADRTKGLMQFAKAQGKSPADLNTQVDYLVHEMKNGDMGAQRAYALLQQAKTPQEAATAMMHFERPQGYTPANPAGGLGFQNRVQYAQALLPNGQPVPQGEGGPPGSPAGPGGSMVPPPQQAFNGPPGASAGIDPLSQQMLLSKRFGKLGEARITNQNQQFNQELERQKFIDKQQQDAIANAGRDVIPDPANPGQFIPNPQALAFKKGVSAVQGTDAEGKMLLGDYEDARKANTEYQSNSSAASRGLNNLEQVRSLLDGLQTGKTKEASTSVKAWLKDMGVDLNSFNLNDDVGRSQAAQALLGQFALQLRNPASGAGMPGSMSNYEQGLLRDMSPSLLKTPEGNKFLLDTMEKAYRRSMEEARISNAFMRSPDAKKDPLALYTKLDEYRQANPIVSEKDAAKFAGTPSAAMPTAPGATSVMPVRRYNPATRRLE